MLYTLVVSCKELGLNPFDYLRDVIVKAGDPGLPCEPDGRAYADQLGSLQGGVAGRWAWPSFARRTSPDGSPWTSNCRGRGRQGSVPVRGRP